MPWSQAVGSESESEDPCDSSSVELTITIPYSSLFIHTGMERSLRFRIRRHCEPALIVLMSKVIVKCGVEFMITAIKVQRRYSLVFTSGASITMLISP